MRITRGKSSKATLKVVILGLLATVVLLLAVLSPSLTANPSLYFLEASPSFTSSNNDAGQQPQTHQIQPQQQKHQQKAAQNNRQSKNPNEDTAIIHTLKDYSHFKMKDAGLCPVQEGCQGSIRPIHEAWSYDAVAADVAQASASNEFTFIQLSKAYRTDALTKHGAVDSYQMITRDPKLDRFISGTLRAGMAHDPHVGHAIVQILQDYYDRQPTTTSPIPLLPIMLDVGTNIGYFTSMALALGARVISFEPMRANYGCVMATVRKNNWRDRHTLYINAVSFEGAVVHMKPTNSGINLSNGHVTDQSCNRSGTEILGQYGEDFMESVSLDQVMLTQHANIPRVHIMKLDIETFEINAINGAVRFFCNRIVEVILVEVQYLKSEHGLTQCDASGMQKMLEEMGYDVWDRLPIRTADGILNGSNGAKLLTGKPFDQLPVDVLFVLKDTTRAPLQRLSDDGAVQNPCKGFEWSEK